MSTPPALTRRESLRFVAWGTVGSVLLPTLMRAAPEPQPASSVGREVRFQLGVASFSLAKAGLDEVIVTLQTLRLSRVALYRSHCPWADGTPEQCRAVTEKLRAAGLTPNATGVVDLPDNEATCRRAFANLRAAGVPLMVCKPEPAALQLLDRLVREYDVRLAIHNHGPEDKSCPSPLETWQRIQALDPRIGVCLDVAHAARSGVDPVVALRTCAPRLYDVHLRDSLAHPGDPKDTEVPIGTGRINIPAILRTLADLGYAGTVAFEIKTREGSAAVGLAESVGYVRGLLATLKTT